MDEIVLPLSPKCLATGEIPAHFDEVFGARVSKDTISRIMQTVVGEMTEWQNPPLDREQFPVVAANQLARGRAFYPAIICAAVRSFRHTCGRSLSSVLTSRNRSSVMRFRSVPSVKYWCSGGLPC